MTLNERVIKRLSDLRAAVHYGSVSGQEIEKELDEVLAALRTEAKRVERMEKGS